MLELGSQAISIHESLVESLSENQIDLVFTTGQYMSALSDILPSHMRGGHATTSQKLLPMVRSVIRPGDVLTIKGSLGSKTGLIVDELLKLECDLGRDTPSRHMAHGN
jgi:UDP-N-acetylmuramoyl-tripeptide--D-alanyl-D-alanine ligase